VISVNLKEELTYENEIGWTVGITSDKGKEIDIPCKNERQAIELADQITSAIRSWSLVDKVELC
jgi:hypothetical protein